MLSGFGFNSEKKNGPASCHPVILLFVRSEWDVANTGKSLKQQTMSEIALKCLLTDVSKYFNKQIITLKPIICYRSCSVQ